MLAEYGFGDLIWTMVVFFFWFMAIWIFIMVFADIFRRQDMGGGAKAMWVLLIVIVPLFGALVYLIARPRVTSGPGPRGSEGYVSTDPIPAGRGTA